MEYTLPQLLSVCEIQKLEATCTDADIEWVCQLAAEKKCAAVSVNSAYTSLAAKLLSGTSVKCCSTVGFPLGATSSEAKAREASIAFENGADEVAMVISVGRLLSNESNYVLQDINSVVEAAKGQMVSVSIEAHTLNEDQIIMVCELAKMAGASYIQTCSGFGQCLATASDVSLIYHLFKHDLKIKATGGITTATDIVAMLGSGATIIGTKSVQSIIDSYSNE